MDTEEGRKYGNKAINKGRHQSLFVLGFVGFKERGRVWGRESDRERERVVDIERFWSWEKC